jgi:hypothetical protein
MWVFHLEKRGERSAVEKRVIRGRPIFMKRDIGKVGNDNCLEFWRRKTDEFIHFSKEMFFFFFYDELHVGIFEIGTTPSPSTTGDAIY